MGNNNILVGLWLDDKRKDPIYFLNQKEKPSKNGKPTSGSIVRNWYKQNMNGVEIQWTAVQNFEQFKNYIETKGVPDFVSLDHDLGDEPSNKIKRDNGERFETGADCALFLVSYCLRSGIPIPRNYIHSANDNKRVFISKAFRLGRMGKDPMEGVNLDNIEEFRVAADRFRAGIMNPNVKKNLKSFLKKNGDKDLGTADRLARMRGINDPESLFNKESFRENRNMKKLIRLTESDLHRIVKESVSRILKEELDDSIFEEDNFDYIVHYENEWQKENYPEEEQNYGYGFKETPKGLEVYQLEDDEPSYLATFRGVSLKNFSSPNGGINDKKLLSFLEREFNKY